MNVLGPDDVAIVRDRVAAGVTLLEIQAEFGITNMTTLSRFCKRHGISRFPAQVSEAEAGDMVEAMKVDADGSPMREAWGEHKVYDCFSALGVRVPRATVRRAMHSRDADGVARRKRRAIVRREYHAPYPNYVWHTDTNMKLVRWGIWIYGTIDGFSRFLLHLVATDNITQRTGVLLHGQSILQYAAIPDLLRVDAGGENNLAMQLQIEVGGAVHVGSSVHNQPIERFWGICRSHVCERYRNIFYDMERSGDLNPADECDLDALRYAFLEGIQEECDVFRATHNSGHKNKRGKPKVLFNQGAPARPTEFSWTDVRHGSRLPFTGETISLRDELVAAMEPQTKMEIFIQAKRANKLLLNEILRF